MPTLMPCDDNDKPIPALRLKPGGAHSADAASGSSRIGPFAPDTRVVSIHPTVPVFIRTGDETVTAGPGDHYFPEGIYYDLSLGAAAGGRHTHLAVTAADAGGSAGGTPANGTLYVSEKE